jgi:short-subunit dehydrogenase
MVKSPYGKVVIITGASSGIGKVTAEYLVQQGYVVYGTSRKGNNGDSTLAKVTMLQLDVCNDESVKNAVEFVLRKEGRLDILINNAGFGIAGAVEDTSTDEVISQFDTNFFGVHRMCKAVMPIMRKQGSGLIINVSSVAAFFTIPYQSIYSATKAAIEVMSEAMRMEAEPFGIKVALVEPGDTKTGFTGSRMTTLEAQSDQSVYAERFKKGLDVMMRDEENGVDPIVVAEAIAKLAANKNPPVRVIVGAKYKLLSVAKRILPARIVLYGLSKIY